MTTLEDEATVSDETVSVYSVNRPYEADQADKANKADKADKVDKVDIMGYLNEDALSEIDKKCADIDVTPEPVPQETNLEHTQVFDIGSTRVYSPAPTDDGYVDEPYEPDPYTVKRQARRKTRNRAGGWQIALLMVVVAGLTWLVSKSAFSVMGSGQDSSEPSVSSVNTSSETVIEFDDSISDTDSSEISEFNTDQLAVGDTGELVLTVQQRLNLLGYLAAESVSGTFDRTTSDAVRQFQKVNGIAQSGIVDKTTYDAMFDDDAATQTTVTTLLPTTTSADIPANTTETTTQPTSATTQSSTAETTTVTTSAETDAPKSTSAETETTTASTAAASTTSATTTVAATVPPSAESAEETAAESVENE